MPQDNLERKDAIAATESCPDSNVDSHRVPNMVNPCTRLYRLESYFRVLPDFTLSVKYVAAERAETKKQLLDHFILHLHELGVGPSSVSFDLKSLGVQLRNEATHITGTSR